MNTSILICTRERADSLRPTLASIGKCDIPHRHTAELVVVDNGSRDGTRQVVEKAHVPNMSIRYINEERVGKCHALNRGIKEAVGTNILFTDDDVLVPPQWLSSMVRTLEDGQFDAVQGGIRLAPHLRQHLQTTAERERFTELLPGAIEGSDANCLVGANMGIRKSVLARVPAFDVDLGPGALGFGDDVLFGLQLRAAGFRIANRLDIAVEHHFDPSRLLRAFVINENYRRGASTAYIDFHWEHTEFNWIRLRLLWQHIKLQALRVARLGRTRQTGISERENGYTTRIGFYRWLIVGGRQRRHYCRQGLVKWLDHGVMEL
jgi:glycosyltransferase involved in cell wall biosynthesis